MSPVAKYLRSSSPYWCMRFSSQGMPKSLTRTTPINTSAQPAILGMKRRRLRSSPELSFEARRTSSVNAIAATSYLRPDGRYFAGNPRLRRAQTHSDRLRSPWDRVFDGDTARQGRLQQDGLRQEPVAERLLLQIAVEKAE